MTSSIRRPSIAPSRESTWPITSCTPWGHTATTSKRIAWPPAILARRRGGRGFGESCTSAASRRATRCSASISRAGSRPDRCCGIVGVPVVEFRASVVIGSGSLSFELIRALVERLPVMICPRWVSTLAQPIGIDDVLAYLAAALHLPDGESRTFEIGGADQASYGDVMREYARQRGLKRDDDLGAAADASFVEPLAGTRDARLRTGRARTDCGTEEPVRRHRSHGARGIPDQAGRFARSDQSRHSVRGSRVRADAVVRCALLGQERQRRRPTRDSAAS